MTLVLDKNFWSRCANAGCVIAPVRTYSTYNAEGNIAPEYFVGIKYAALSFCDEAVGPDYYIEIEEGQTGLERLYATPEEALAAFESGKWAA